MNADGGELSLDACEQYFALVTRQFSGRSRGT
jgi:hypothetical protein